MPDSLDDDGPPERDPGGYLSLTRAEREALYAASVGGFYNETGDRASTRIAAQLGLQRQVFLQRVRAAERKMGLASSRRDRQLDASDESESGG